MPAATKAKPGVHKSVLSKAAIEELESFETIKTKGKSRAKPTPTEPAVSAGSLLAGVEVIEERDVDFAKIKRSAENPRTVFDEDMIADMAPTITTICQLNPLTIREGTLELIDGETRHRAGQAGKAKQLRCKIVRCTDAQAACIRLLTSLQRRDLNAIDRAKGIKALQEQHGLSQRQMKDLLKLEQSSISNLTRLLDLPDEWQAKVIAGEITATAARDLCPWSTEPAVLDYVLEQIAKSPANERNIVLAELIEDALKACSRPLKEDYYYDRVESRNRNVNLNPTEEQREALRIRMVTNFRGKSERCFNVELWEELQAADEAKRSAAAAKKIEKEDSQKEISAEEAAERRDKQKKQFQARIYRYKVEWLQARLLERLSKASNETLIKYLIFFTTRDGESQRSEIVAGELGGRKKYQGRALSDEQISMLMDLDPQKTWASVRSFLRQWLSVNFEAYHSGIDAESVEIFASDAGIDLTRDWPPSCQGAGAASGKVLQEYLDLLNKEQLLDLIAEWKLPPETEKPKRGETIAAINAIAKGKPVPKALANAKPVRSN